MLKRQAAGPQISDPATIAASVQLLAQVYGEEHNIDWRFFEETVTMGWKSVEERLERTGPLTPTRFSRKEANERLAASPAICMPRGNMGSETVHFYRCAPFECPLLPERS